MEMHFMELMRNRYTALLLMGNIAEDTMRSLYHMPCADQLLESLTETEEKGLYVWQDIDYETANRSVWPAANHYARLLAILIGNSPDRLKNDGVYREKTVGALRFWLARDFSNPNWWYNDIGVPKNIGDIALLLYEAMDDETLEKAVGIVSRGSMAVCSDISEKWTGTNLLWGGVNTIKHALLTDDEALFAKAIERISREISIGTEGIQSDGSFFQHGRRLYSGGYGRSFAYDIAQLVYLLQGTKYQFAKERLHLFLTHVLDGLRYMTRGDALDIAAINRELARENAVQTGLLKRALLLMDQVADIPRKEEIKAYIASTEGGKQWEGTKFFDQAMMLCHHSRGVYVGAKFASCDLSDQDSCNSEGELCLNMTYGTHISVMRDGSEYMNIMPLWDFSKVPGTTARSETDIQLQAHFDQHNWCCDPLPNDHSGGKQVGDHALIFERAQHDGIEAYVTDFAFPGGFVSLGAGIKDEKHGPEPLVTTIDQCLKQGDIQTNGNDILHHGIRYTGLQGTKIECSVQRKEGDWNRLNPFTPSKKLEGEIFLLTVTHENTDQYAYMISSADIETPKVTVLRNDEGVQAIVTPEGKLMAVFHSRGTLVYGERMLQGERKDIVIEQTERR